MRKHFLLADHGDATDWMLSKTGRKGNEGDYTGPRGLSTGLARTRTRGTIPMMVSSRSSLKITARLHLRLRNTVKNNAEELRLWKLKKKCERPLGRVAARAKVKKREEVTSAAGP
jgi:hypothetical protein